LEYTVIVITDVSEIILPTHISCCES